MTVKGCMAQHNQACYLSFSHVWLKTCHILVTLPMLHCPCAQCDLVVIVPAYMVYSNGCWHRYISAEAKGLPREGHRLLHTHVHRPLGFTFFTRLHTLQSLRLLEHALEGGWGGEGRGLC